MASDQTLRSEVEALREIRDRLEGMRLRKKIRQHLNEPGNDWKTMMGIGIAATFLLIAGLLWWNQPNPALEGDGSLPRQSPKQANEPPLPHDRTVPTGPGLEHPRASLPPTEAETIENTSPSSGSDEVSPTNRTDLLRRTIASLDIDEYRIMSRAATDWESIIVVINQAALFLRQGQPALAEEQLKLIPADASEMLREESEWLLALTWMTQGKGKGDSLMTSIASKPDHAYRLQALQLKVLLDRNKEGR